jgi:bifunctional DNase/RNase
MNKSVVPVEVRSVWPFNQGRAIFLGNEQKAFVIYVDELVGGAISMYIKGAPRERPLTHDLMCHMMKALGARVERVVVNDVKSETFFARLIVSCENELFERKIIELDGRPSDCIALAISQKAPIYVAREVWDEVEDRSDLLRQIEENEQAAAPEAEPEEDGPQDV